MTDLNPLFTRVRDEQDQLRTRADHLPRLAARLSARVAPVGRGRTWLVGLAAAVVVGVAILLVFALRPAELEVRVAGSSDRVPTGVWLGAPSGQDLPLDFSDGTSVSLAAEAEARIVSLSRSSVELELKRGLARFDVAPRDGSSFSVRAGPYAVLVTGTRFDVRWSPDSDAFVVNLHEGHVTLSGCGFGEGRQLAAGQTARARCADSHVSIGYADERRKSGSTPATPAESRSEPKQSETGPPVSSAQEPKAPAPEDETRVAPADDRSRPSWQELSRKGAHREALAAVEAAGFEKEVARSSASELIMLADAAQHAGALGRARRALQLVRQRFSGSEEAGFASFALGRLEFDGFGAHAKAAQWFRTYLREQPSGPFAREALGRLMEAVRHGGNEAEARRLAKSYLRRYPSGPHAELASRLAAQP